TVESRRMSGATAGAAEFSDGAGTANESNPKIHLMPKHFITISETRLPGRLDSLGEKSRVLEADQAQIGALLSIRVNKYNRWKRFDIELHRQHYGGRTVVRQVRTERQKALCG